jgi:hypothetical protein
MRLTDSEFRIRAIEAVRQGPEALAEFLLDHVAQKPHSHMADEIVDFDEAVTQIVEDTGEAEDIDDEDEELLG